MRAAIYIRVSSAEQAEEGYSIQAQTEKLEAYCKVRDWSIYNTYIDPGFTGANTKRPALQELIKAIKKHEIDVVVVYKLDRFTRSQKDCINLLDDIFMPNNCDFVSINENFDTSTPYGRAMIGILSVFAQLERETIRERTVMGRIERAKDGLYSGNTRIPIGYDYVDGKLVINEYEAMQIREMFEMYNAGASAWSIYNTFKEKGYTTKHGPWSGGGVIRRLIKSRLYHGELKYKGEHYKGKHEAIITKEIWEKAQSTNKLMHENLKGQSKRPFSSFHLLTGLLYCGNCGARMHGKTRTKSEYPVYMCYSYSKQADKYITNRDCKPHIWQCWEVEEMALEKIRSLTHDEIKSIKKKNDEPDMKVVKKRISDIEKNISKLMDLYLMEGISKESIEKKAKQLSDEKELLEKQLTESPVKLSVKEVLKIIKDIDIIMKHGSLEDKKSTLALIISKIDVYDKNIEVTWNF
jgi:site-specific DNA recombinase